MGTIDGNGPVVEPTNFELGIAGDRELENWTRCYRKELMRQLTSHGAQSNVLEGWRLEHEIAQAMKIGRKIQIAAFIIDQPPFCE
jgi:hypothetical protein